LSAIEFAGARSSLLRPPEASFAVVVVVPLDLPVVWRARGYCVWRRWVRRTAWGGLLDLSLLRRGPSDRHRRPHHECADSNRRRLTVTRCSLTRAMVPS